MQESSVTSWWEWGEEAWWQTAVAGCSSTEPDSYLSQEGQTITWVLQHFPSEEGRGCKLRSLLFPSHVLPHIHPSPFVSWFPKQASLFYDCPIPSSHPSTLYSSISITNVTPLLGRHLWILLPKTTSWSLNSHDLLCAFFSRVLSILEHYCLCFHCSIVWVLQLLL